jgi:hypothetical protein
MTEKNIEIDAIKTGRDLAKNIIVDFVVGIFLIAGLWTISRGFLVMYDYIIIQTYPEPSKMGDILFWGIEGVFFLFLGLETRKYRKIKLG